MNHKLAAVASLVVTTMTVKHDGHEKHWWWDNLNHFIGGFAIGLVLPTETEKRLFPAIAILWEAFEYGLARCKLYERFEWFPEGPRSLGYDGWEFDHQAEDTVLDTLMGYYGVKTAVRLKEQMERL